jgi:methylmalonyl-CoA/ethylmalonyl-CoA epimerase
MYQKIDHLAIVVKDLDEALKLYRDTLGFEFTGVADFPKTGIKQAFFPVGESFFQLVAPADPQGAVAKYLEQHGEGMYLIAVTVDDLRATLDKLKEHGARIVGDTPENIAQGGLVFIHPKSTKGVLIQLIEKENVARNQALASQDE